MRSASVERITKETQIKGSLKIEGRGRYEISTGIRFFDHMLELFTKHGGFDLKLQATGDLDVDQHHTVEDVGIVLGQLVSKALGDRKGINRAGYFVMTMDETLAVVALDLGGRPALVYDDKVKVRLVGDLQTELVEDFFGGFVNHAGANLHAKVLYGRSNHHKIEAIFKCFARALRYACSKDARLKEQLPSTKGLLVIIDSRLRRGNLRSVQNTLGEIGAEYELVRDAAGARPRDENHSAGRWPLRTNDARAGSDAGARGAAGAHSRGRSVSRNLPGPAGPVRIERRSARRARAWDVSRRDPALSGHRARAAHGLERDRAARNGAKLLKNLAPHPYLYFAHSYYAPVNEATAATCEYTRSLHGGA